MKKLLFLELIIVAILVILSVCATNPDNECFGLESLSSSQQVHVDVFGVPTEFTTRNVTIYVQAQDGVAYKFKGQQEFSANNSFVVKQNMIFEIGDIQVKLENQEIIHNLIPIVIDKIDKESPFLFVDCNHESFSESEVLKITASSSISGIKSVTYKYNSGEEIDITDSYKNGLIIRENGIYTIKVVSNAGNITQTSVSFENLGRELNNIQKGILYILSAIVVLFGTLAIFMTVQRIANKKNHTVSK